MINQLPIGIMQGRLSPSQQGLLQFFPCDWEKEFKLARDFGFSSMEWVFDWRDYRKNPIWGNRAKIKPIVNLAREYGIPIRSACFDYLMKYTLFEGDEKRFMAADVLRTMIPKLSRIGVKIITIAFVEHVAIKTEEEKKQIRSALLSFDKQLESFDMSLALETEISGSELKDYIDSFNSPRIGVCYDTGNCITMGHDSPRDIVILGTRIKEVHLKDRKVGSMQSVYLGTGDVQFLDCFRSLDRIQFSGPHILQAWRGEDYLGDAKRQLEYIIKIWQQTKGGGRHESKF